MTNSEFVTRQLRASPNRALFREVNDRIDELAVHTRNVPLRYLCECDDPSCSESIGIPREEYQQVRRDPAESIVVPGHERLEVEVVVHREHERWLIVRSLGAGAALAAELAEFAVMSSVGS